MGEGEGAGDEVGCEGEVLGEGGVLGCNRKVVWGCVG